MHACGHDGHTAMLLAAAKHLSKHRNYDGTVYLIFQPAEEGGGGAREMIKDGIFDKFPMEAVFGAHNWPGMKAGQFALKTGPAFASSNEFRIVIRGKGSHAAMPHNGIDPVPAACADGAGVPDHRQPQQAADRPGRDLGHHDPRRRGDQRRARQLRDPGHGAHLHARGARPDRAAHEGRRREHLRRLRGRVRVRVHPQLPADDQPSGRDRVRAQGDDRDGRRRERARVRADHGLRGLQLLPAREARLLLPDRQRRRQRTATAATASAPACCTTRATTSTTS